MSVEFTPGAKLRRVVLWRHGRTEWNDSRRFQGQIDSALDDVGLAQAARAAQQLAALKPALIVTSDLARAADTAQALADLVNVPVRSTAALRETDGGSWQGQYADDLKSDQLYVAWLAGEDVPAGGAETRSQVGDRAAAVVREAAADLDAGGLAVVASHGGTIRAVIGRMLGLPVEHWRVLGGLANCCWSVLEEGRTGWRLAEHNAGSLPEAVLGDDR
ncbi:MAG: histidine phosphatase family protein [Actinomycetia bacterium]|nr:histidine phosphatase family protein [Actinomycetes bacterium]